MTFNNTIIKMPLTFIDNINDVENVRQELRNNVIPDIRPTQKANITSALENTLRLFEDSKDQAQFTCDSQTLYFITNGHIQCGPCLCEEDEMCDIYNIQEADEDWKCYQYTHQQVVYAFHHVIIQ